MPLWLLFAFCALAAVFGLWSILRDLNRGRVSGRGFGFDRATQPVGFFALISFNCVAVALFFIGSIVLGLSLLRRLTTS